MPSKTKKKPETITNTVYRDENGQFAPRKATKLRSTRNDRRRAQNRAIMQEPFELQPEELPYRRPQPIKRSSDTTLPKRPTSTALPSQRLLVVTFGNGMVVGAGVALLGVSIAYLVVNLS